MTTGALHVLLPTDVFPPRCGGAGWSAHALALALLARGHTVTAIVPRAGAGDTALDTLGVPTRVLGYRAARLPFVRNASRHEWLWPRIASVITAEIQGQTIIHAQHTQVTPAAVLAGRRSGTPVVVTVRDHWPWDYFATGLHGNRIPYPRQDLAALATDLPARLGPLRGSIALAALPYVLGHTARRRRALAQADAVIAVSQYIADRLAGIVAADRLHVVPNMVNLAAIDATIVTPPEAIAPGQRFVLFVGKLEANKGADLLPAIIAGLRDARCDNGTRPALVVCGDGPLSAAVARAADDAGITAHLLAWAAHDEVLRLMARCDVLLFPSAWGEPLSRVLLEASACGTPVVAMPTGGTPDIIIDEQTGVLARTPAALAAATTALLADPAARRRYRTTIRAHAAQRFATDAVVPQVEAIYRAVARGGGAAGRGRAVGRRWGRV